MLVDINLLPQKERDRPAFLIAALSILLLGLVIFAALFFMAKSENTEQAVLAAQSAELATQQAEIRAQLEATAGLNEEQQLKATVDWAESYQYDTIPLLEELAALLPARGFFDQIAFAEPNTATLTVQFDATRDAAYYLAQLKGSELLDFASLDSVESEDSLLTEEDETKKEDEPIETPRYLATYTLVFVDDRLPVLDAEGNIVEEPVEETPASETEENVEADVDVEVEVIEETETTPEETEGDTNE
ncbi:fimbrial assembly protein [Planomicrobium sp. Y74]|uniref:fimbrial assembly protein n=1 Tax=Planomicrobium sp. Y74 TaxID=2478977 RepID=UPI000EF4DC03|nr:fimbrial assembly protein [Planomicrobium sp. Y74]RLQ91987.1 fimbrial assembly protein [Planomicrobium sp. Y74]